MSVDFAQRQREFAAHLRDPNRFAAPPGLEERRLAIYRDLFFNNVEDLLANGFPVIHTILDASEWQSLVRDWYRDHTSHTPLFTELGREFVKYLESRGETGDLPRPFLAELAHYEWAEAALLLDDAQEQKPSDLIEPHQLTAAMALGQHQLVIRAPLHVFAYAWPVHRIRPEFQPETPSESPHYLILLRDEEDQVQFVECNALTALVVDVCQRNPGLNLDGVLMHLAEQQGLEPTSLIPHGADLVRNLSAHQVALGVVPVKA